jgi:hypothetical protein
MTGLLIGKRPGKLRRGAWLIVLWLVVSLLAATVWLWTDAGNMTAAQHYVWSGWYRIFFFGFNFEMLLLLVGLIALRLFRLVRSTVRRPTKRPA